MRGGALAAALLLAARGLAGPTPDAPHGAGKKDAYDCTSSWVWWQTTFLGQKWSREQKEWCCTHKKLGCEALAAARKSPRYDCEKDLRHWDHAWSDDKKRWCCEHKNRGCLAHQWSSEPYNCQDDLSEWKVKWPKGKKDWCCTYDNLGCEPATTTTTTLEPHDCRDGLSNWRSDWTASKKRWCCEHYEKGCETAAGGFDCKAGPVREWSDEHRAQCCETHHVGCMTTTTTITSTARTTTTRTTMSTTPPYDCGKKGMWPAAQQAWCCAHEMRGCTTCDAVCNVDNVAASCRSRIAWLQTNTYSKHHSACERALRTVLDECSACSSCDLDDACPVGAGAPAPYRCNSKLANDEQSWSPAKRLYCCKHEEKGCPTTVTTTTTKVYDCTEGIEHWQSQWPHAKRVWCCKTSQIGCSPCDTVCTLNGFDASCRDRIEWLEQHDYTNLANACSSARSVVLDQCDSCGHCSVKDACPYEEEDKFDCEDDSRTYEWSEEMRSWCCKYRAKGCKASRAHGHGGTDGNSSSEESFDCQEEVDRLETSWSLTKRAYCCVHRNMGCPDAFDCDEALATWEASWSQDKKDFCCAKKSVGCREGSSPNAAAAGVPKYDCQSPAEARRSRSHQSWCCEREGVGCEDLGPSLAEKDGVAGQRWNCKDGVLNWAQDWSTTKQAWCCKNFLLGCPTLIDGGGGGATPSPSQVLSKFDCQLGLGNWRASWTIQKAEWCCAHASKGCDREAPGPASAGAETGAGTQEFRYKCGAADEHGMDAWTQDQRQWCCKRHGRGCGDAPDIYDCKMNSAFAEKAWSPRKKAWCCKHKDLCTTPPELASSTPRPSTSRADETPAPVAEEEEGTASTADDAATVVDEAAVGLPTGCYQVDMTYLPLDMVSQVMSYEDSAKECQARCKMTPDCTHFSYFLREGICHVTDNWSRPQVGSIGAVSGPVECKVHLDEVYTWVRKDALPEVEGSTYDYIDPNVQTLAEMKEWCEGHTDCVGFARQPDAGRWYPAKVGTGFDAQTAVWTESWHSHWQWYYIKERGSVPQQLQAVQKFDFDGLKAAGGDHGAGVRAKLSVLGVGAVFAAVAALAIRRGRAAGAVAGHQYLVIDSAAPPLL